MYSLHVASQLFVSSMCAKTDQSFTILHHFKISPKVVRDVVSSHTAIYGILLHGSQMHTHGFDWWMGHYLMNNGHIHSATAKLKTGNISFVSFFARPPN